MARRYLWRSVPRHVRKDLAVNVIASCSSQLATVYPDLKGRRLMSEVEDLIEDIVRRAIKLAPTQNAIYSERVMGAAGFSPGVLVVPETDVLFVGAGERLLAYDLAHPARLWEDVAKVGFWGWARYGDVVVMSAELELAAWDIEGTKLWTTFVEPPWSYEVTDDILKLDIMGVKSEFSLGRGPEDR